MAKKDDDFDTVVGKGGETHQQVPKKASPLKSDIHLTTNQGIRVADNQNSPTIFGRNRNRQKEP